MHAPTRTAGAFFGDGEVLSLVSENATGPGTVALAAPAPASGLVATVSSADFWRSDRIGFVWWLALGLYIRKRIGSLATE